MTEVAPPGIEPPAPNSTAELRTFLFADIRGYTRFTQERGDREAARLVERFASLMRDGVRARGGEVLELRGDEVLAIFSSARQALRAAVDLQARFTRESASDPSLPLPVGIGIDAGEAVRFESGYRGESLNLAARLCNLAGPGEVLASEGVVYLGRHVQGVSYAERGLVPIKGFADPVRVIRVIGNGEVSQPPRPEVSPDHAEAPMPIGGFLGALPPGNLVAREQEWEQIMTSLEGVMQGSGRLLLLAGEPGIGKTRLAQEVTLKVRHWGFLVATGRCYEQERSVPYYPFLEALVMLYGACHPSIRADIPRRWPQLGRLMPEQIGIIPPIGLLSGAQEQEDQHLLFRAVTGFVEAVAETMPVALLLDDLHWADDSSLKLLQHLARYTHGSRVLLLGTYRDVDVHRQHPLETALLDLDREQLVEEVMIRHLDQEGTADLVAEILGEKEDLTELSELVYRRTEGNAFFVHEMLRALVERGDVYRKDGHWEQRKIREMEVPKSIRSLIGQRLSRLEEPAQEILREASVLGQEFAFDDLLALGSLTHGTRNGPHGSDRAAWAEDEIEGALEQAKVAGLVRETGADTYAFNHAITQQALYDEITTRRKKRLHLAAGKALQRLPESGREHRAGELAWHFLEGDDPEQALRYAILAGDQAWEVFANGEAQQQYCTALELATELGDQDREVEALEKLAGVLTVRAQYDQALELLERAADRHSSAGNRDGEACAVAAMGQVHLQRETLKEGIARLEPLIKTLEAESGDDNAKGLAALWAALATLYVETGNEERLKASERAVQLARSITEHPETDRLLLGAQVTHSEALWMSGQDDDAIRAMEELIPRAEAVGDLDNLARALGSAAIYYGRRGEYTKDRQYHERMLEIAERRGDHGKILLGAMELNTNAFLRGDWEQAHRYLERAEEIIRTLGTTHLAIWPLAARGWMCLRSGDLDDAVGYAVDVLSLTEQGRDTWLRLAERLLAERELLERRPAAALERLEPSLSRNGWKRDAGFLWTLARVHLDLGNQDEAQVLAAQSVERARTRRHRPDLAEALVVQGMVMTRQGTWEESERIFDEALEIARAIPFPYGEARALQEYGMMHAQKGETNPAQRRLKRALAIFERLGARKDVELAQQALATVRSV